MFSKKDFQTWGVQNAILFAAVMTKIEGRKDDDLLRTYEFRGFPSMAILDAEGNAITKQVPRDLFSMKTIVGATPAYVKLSADVEAGNDVDAKAWFMARLAMGKLDAAEAKALLESTGVSGDAKAKAEKILFVLQMNELWGSTRGRNVTEEDRMAACAAVYEAFKAGKRLPPGASPEMFVDDMLIEAGESNHDAEAFFFAYERVRTRRLERIQQLEDLLPRYREDPKLKDNLGRLEAFIADSREKLEELEALAKKLKS